MLDPSLLGLTTNGNFKTLFLIIFLILEILKLFLLMIKKAGVLIRFLINIFLQLICSLHSLRQLHQNEYMEFLSIQKNFEQNHLLPLSVECIENYIRLAFTYVKKRFKFRIKNFYFVSHSFDRFYASFSSFNTYLSL